MLLIFLESALPWICIMKKPAHSTDSHKNIWDKNKMHQATSFASKNSIRPKLVLELFSTSHTTIHFPLRIEKWICLYSPVSQKKFQLSSYWGWSILWDLFGVFGNGKLCPYLSGSCTSHHQTFFIISCSTAQVEGFVWISPK